MSVKSRKLRKVNTTSEKTTVGRILGDLKYRLVIEGVGVGLCTGVVISLFRLILSKADGIRNELIAGSKEKFLVAMVSLLIFFFLGAVTVIMTKIEPQSKGSGIPLVKGELEGKVKTKWFSVLACKFIGAVCAIYAGLSLGHEGPSIQLGAMVGKGFSRLNGRLVEEERYLLIAGAGAGIAAAFNAPLAGVLFVLEEFRRKFSHKVLLSTLSASVVSAWVASTVFGLDPVFEINLDGSGIPIYHYWEIVLFGLILGAFGWLHNATLLLSQKLFSKAKGYIKVALPAVVIIILAKLYPLTLGSGHGLVGLVAGDMTIKAIIVLLVIKFLFSMFSSGFGAPGGILLPLLVMGAIAGSLFTRFFSPLVGYDMLISYYIILGMAGFFSAIVRSPITGIVLICEMTGALECMLPIAIVSLIAYLTAELLGAKPIYQALFDKMFNDSTKLNENTGK